MKYLLIAIFMILLVVSCKENGTDNNTKSKEIWPLAIGNSWTHALYKHYSSKIDSVRFLDSVEMHVSKKIILNNEDWFFIESNGKTANTVLTNRNDGLWAIDFKDSTNININTAKLVLKYPTYLNELYPIDSTGSKSIDLNCKVVTPAGTFSCIRYSDNKHLGLEFYGEYFTPGIGKILGEHILGIEYILPIPDTTWQREILVNYKINN